MNDEPICPDCGEIALWEDCEDCGGKGVDGLFQRCPMCNGDGGQYLCDGFCEEYFEDDEF